MMGDYGLTSPNALRYNLAVVCAGAALLIIGILGGLGLQEFGTRTASNIAVISSNSSPGYAGMVDMNFSTTGGFLHEVYFWNLTNPASVNAGGKPDFKQTGPILLRFYERSEDLEFNANRTEMSYLQRVVNVWSGEGPTMSDFNITMINPFYFGTILSAGSEQAIVVSMTSVSLLQIVNNLLSSQFQLQASSGTTAAMLPQERLLFAQHIGDANFLRIWANATADPPGVHAGMRLSTSGFSSNITYPQAIQLWNCTKTSSFCSNVQNQGVNLWISAAHNNSAAANALIAATGLSALQVTMVATWLEAYRVNITLPTMLVRYNVTTATDLGYVQWGTGKVLGVLSVSDVIPQPVIPEFAIFAKRNLNLTIALTMNQTKSLLSGTYALTSATNMGAFLNLVKAQDWAEIQNRYRIAPPIAVPLSMYIGNLTAGFVKPRLQACFANGGGMIATRSAEQWLFGTQNGVPSPDPFLQLLGVTPNIRKLLVNDTTVEEAEIRNQRFTKKTGKFNLTEVSYLTRRNGQESWLWATPTPVRGYDGTRVPPFENVKDMPESFIMWNDELKRSYTTRFKNWSMVFDVNCSVYIPTGEAKNIDPAFWNYISGLSNVSALSNNVPLFASYPHLTLGGEYWMNNFTSDMDPNAEQYTTALYVDPYSGMTVRAVTMSQTNLLFGSQYGAKFSTLNPYVPRDTLYPIMWVRKSVTATESKAGQLKMLENCESAGKVFILVVPIISAAIFAVGAFMVSVWVIAQATSSLSPDEIPEFKPSANDCIE